MAGPQHGRFLVNRRLVARPPIRGVTLVEAMVVVAVLSILTSIAVPSFSTFLGRSSTLGVESEFVNAVSFARSEAMRRGVPVAVTAKSPVGGNGFGQGWFIWVDSNASSAFNTADPVLRTHAAYPADVSLGDGSVTQIYFNQQGYLVGGLWQLKACSTNAAGATGYQITITAGGVIDVLDAVSCP